MIRSIKNRGLKKITALLMATVFVCTGVTSCSKTGEDSRTPEYGTYGADFARKMATDYPHRTAYSNQEQAAGEMIRAEFEELGYEVETQPFTGAGGKTSNNYIIRIAGEGFVGDPDEDGVYTDIRRTAIIGAHYDAALSSGGFYDGISGNASGVACLVTAAAQIREYSHIGFDVVIVAFGAGYDNYAGARAFLNSMSEEEKDNIEVMYCIDSIYSGDKIYASAGFNSLIPDQKYEMRRKLYQVYDVAYDNMLSSNYGFNLLYNESNYTADINGDGHKDIYREVSANRSDYVVFDNSDIQIVFFDSFDYNFDTMEEMKETKNLTLQDYDGMIRGTPLDSMRTLDEIYLTEEEDRLEIRVNNVSFCILESLLKGSDDGMTYPEYEEYLEDLKETEEESETSSTESETVVAPVIGGQ